MKRCFAVLALAFLAVSFGFGQIGQTGQITVTVVDKDGVPLGGVTVTITSPDMVVARMDRVTNPSGVARFPSLNPGTYEIKCEITGFNTTVRKDIIVNAGITSAIDVDMAEAAIGEEIVVVGLSPTVDRQSTTKTSTLDTNFVANVPASRDLDTLFNMTPEWTAGTAWMAARSARTRSTGRRRQRHDSDDRHVTIDLLNDRRRSSDPKRGLPAEYWFRFMVCRQRRQQIRR